MIAIGRLNRPALMVYGGTIKPGHLGDRTLDIISAFQSYGEYIAGHISDEERQQIVEHSCPGPGACGGMYTANTMASAIEALGMTLPYSSSTPAVDPKKREECFAAGKAIAHLLERDFKPRDIMTRDAFENAMVVVTVLGGSTNAVLHLTAIAGRAGVEIDLRHLNEISDTTPVIVDLKPTGPHYMEDLFAAGGIGAVLRELQPLLHLDCMTVAGETLGERLAGPAGPVDREVVRPLAEPLQPQGGLVALFGSLAPKGAIFKRSAADPKLFEKEGRAVVFTSLEDLSARIDDPDLDVTPDDFMVLQHAGPLSPSGMPEAGYLPIPAKLARAGIKDMVRISDARMSGTAYGSIVLHVTPDAASGGPLAKVRNGDRIRLSVKDRRLDLLVAPEELARRKTASAPVPERGYARLYRREILQADRGCDFDFLRKHPLGDGRA